MIQYDLPKAYALRRHLDHFIIIYIFKCLLKA